MNEESNNSKQKKSVAPLLIFLFIILFLIIAWIFIVYLPTHASNTNTADNSISKADENIEEPVTTSKYVAAFKYDLQKNKLSDFDIAFLKVENKDENKIYSPLSIKYTLKMLEEGANGVSKQQISNVLENYDVTKYVSNQNLSLANVLFVRDTFKDNIKETYIDNLQRKYNADVIFDSFSSTNNINGWVKNKTLNIIPEILDEISDDQDFLLINALGIDMEWNHKFLWDQSFSEEGFKDSVYYNHEKYYTTCNKETVSSQSFDNEKLEVSGMEIMASIDNYDIVNILGEENIRKTVGDSYRAWIKENGTDLWGSPLRNSSEIEKEIARYLDEYIEEIKNNYIENREVKSTDFSVYTDTDVKVFAKDLKNYNGTTLQYIGIMPTTQNLDQYVKTVDSTKLNNIIKNLKELKNDNFKEGAITRIKGFIPKFNFEYTLKLKEDLAEIGITDIFNSDKANISELTDVNGAYISDAIHKSNIEFTQDGIKAAAATMAGGKGAGGPEFDYIYDVPIEEIDLTFDKPYMFIIRDKDTGDVWFTGTVYEPLEFANDTTVEHYY